MNDSFASPRSLLKRSRRHLDEYRHQHATYVGKRPYQLITEREPSTGGEVRKVRVVEGYPIDLGSIVFDAVNCLRSAMDHAVFAATTLLTSKDFDPQSVKFPFGRTIDDIKRELVKGRARNVSPELHDILFEFAPYESGDKTLYGFNEIRNENIHRILSPIAHVRGNTGIGGRGYIGRMELVNEWNPENRELIYAKGQNIDPGIKIDVAIEISFGENSGLPLRPVLETLKTIADTTEQIISRLKGEASRIRREGP